MTAQPVDQVAAEASAAEAALARVLAGEPFRRSARLGTFLRFVVEETAAGRGHLLREHQIAVGALGCPDTFDPRFDARVRVLATRVRKALAQYYSGDGASDPVRIDMPRGAYRTRLVAAELAPAALASVRPVADAGPAIAVVHPVDLDPVGGRSHLAAGFAEALVATMSAYPGCRVIGPVSRGTGGDGVEQARALGALLGATHVLQGSIRSTASMVRVSVRLSDASTGEIRWSQVFDEDVDGLELFEVEDRIAAKVAGVVADFRGAVHQGRVRSGGQEDAGSYDAMLQYYAYLGDLDTAKVAPTIAALEHALQRSPEDPLLMAMLAGMVLFNAVGQFGSATSTERSEEEVSRSVELARRANAIDPANPHALTVLAMVELLHGRVDRCRAELDRVVELRPTNPSLLFMAGVGLAMCGDWSGGIERIEASMELNALHPGWQHGFLSVDALLHRDPALALAEAQLVDTPGLAWGPLLRAAALAADGRLDAAAAELAQMPAALPEEQPTRQDLFLGYMHLPDEVVACLLDALAKIPPGT